ncbi:hypothetical protein VOLCADRAFT_97380 [Volvox carteri f. nagariensis]|uniref:Uncharacterized protein n=1 Tax=Volvox carteri f. nagariensis TaxID=3068 RepID=D8UCL5_VOLCA|nr:uncharacterized protein VOLCADRAFT_97380 [Volvox carteri f. nagariensis]EFJ42513.1 hypothetical protein VOLCADRAFT_97380 [Volvox carteri f. nagariensis]|eukprot:XP_002956369.1 hypothetical protein VOLCADRAFT_97380 [Volvox carteri f. nagariensis]
MGRLKGAKNAIDYFGSGQKATGQKDQVHQPSSTSSPFSSQQQVQQAQQQESGFRRFLSLFRGGSQAAQPQEGPSSRAASSFLLAWRSTRVPADVLNLDRHKASHSFASQLAPSWESKATGGVAASSSKLPSPPQPQPPSSQQILDQQKASEEQGRAADRERLADEQRRRQQQAAKLQELQRQATLKERADVAAASAAAGVRLEYQPSQRRGAGGGEEGTGAGEVPEVTAVERPGAPGRPCDCGPPPATPPPPPYREDGEVQQQQQQQQLEQPQGLQQQRQPDTVLKVDGAHGSHQLGDPAARASGADPRVTKSMRRMDLPPSSPSFAAAASANNLANPRGDTGGAVGTGVVAPPVLSGCSSNNYGRLSLGGIPYDVHQQQISLSAATSASTSGLPALPPLHPPASPRLPLSAAPLALTSALPSTPKAGVSPSLAAPALEVTLLALAPAQPSSPTMDIILGAGPPKVAAAAGSGDLPTSTPLARQRSNRSITDMGGCGGRPLEGLGPPSLTAAVALATGADLRPVREPLRRVSMPAVFGYSSVRRTLNSLQSQRHSYNGMATAGGVSGGGGGGAAAAAADCSYSQKRDRPASSSGIAVPVLNRSYSQQREYNEQQSAYGSAPTEQQPNWRYWKNRAQESNWGLWKSHSNMSSKLRQDLDGRAAEEVGDSARRSSGSGTNFPVPRGSGGGSNSSATAPRWKHMLEATMAVLSASDRSLGGGSSGGGGADSPIRAATTAATQAALGEHGSGSDRSYDGMAALPGALTRVNTVRTPRAVTPAARTGRVLLRVPTQRPTLIACASNSSIDDGDGGSGSCSGRQSDGVESGEFERIAAPPSSGVATATGTSPRGGRRGAAAAVGPQPQPPLPSRLSAQSGGVTGQQPTSPSVAAASMSTTASPRVAMGERARERSQTAADDHVAKASPRPVRLSAPNAPIPPATTPTPLPRLAPSPPSGGHGTSSLTAAVAAAAGGAAPLAPSPSVGHRVSPVGGGVGGGGGPYDEPLRSGPVCAVNARDGDSEGPPPPPPPPPPPAAEMPPRVGANGLGANPRSRRVLYVAGGFGEQPQDLSGASVAAVVNLAAAVKRTSDVVGRRTPSIRRCFSGVASLMLPALPVALLVCV